MTQPAFFRAKGGAADLNEASRHDPDAISALMLPQFTRGAVWRVAVMHDRRENVLVWITRGQGRVYIDGIRRGVSGHNAIFIPAGTLFALDLSAQSQAQVIVSPQGRTGLLPKRPLHLRVRDGLAQAELTGEFEAMQREMNLKRPHLQEALASRLGLVAVWLRRQDGAGAADAPRETAAQRLARRFSAMVVENFRTDMAMQDYAGALNVTPTHLTRVLRECSGFTAADILTARKLYEARVLLEDSPARVREIAEVLGFHSAAYFTRFVQTHTGLTPTALRGSARP